MSCSGSKGDKTEAEKTARVSDYSFGEDTTYHSSSPVTYSMLYSDHENYPYKKDWRLWSAIKEKTNVSFDLTIVARTDYEDKKSALVNSGDAPYIIPKTYDESAYVSSGQIVPISDYVQYMPNYMSQVKAWGMDADLKQKLQSNGKYYVLPGMWEEPSAGYSLIIRKDVFEKAGVDVDKLEKNWTWEDFYNACLKVKEYTGSDYVWSDQYNSAAAMSISSKEYGVLAGRSSDGGDWNLKNGTKFNWEKNQFEFADISENFKTFLSFWNKMYESGIMDPETYSQDSDTAQAKFYSGSSYVLTANYQQLADMQANNKVQVPGAELYMVVCPGGPAGLLQTEQSRLENGIMISKSALDDLGEEGFIKMLRFIDWLWYSNEGHTLSLWGVEGETYTKDANDKIKLNNDIYYNGINPGAPKQLNVDYGFGGGVFAYGGSTAIRNSKMTVAEADFSNRTLTKRAKPELDPPIMATEDQAEELALIQTPLMDYVNLMTLSFITGKKDIQTGWDDYVTECTNKGSQKYIDKVNTIFESTKGILWL
ncbi:MAG: extracellular solute-binding protein [Peptostreptococcaceae bacterium]|nr:extracellular solute-binding protein [Peptostreptococcaceae bacterium]